MQIGFKLIKKSLALFLTVALCFSALVTGVSAVGVTGTASIDVTYPKAFENVFVGGTVNVTVTIASGNTNARIAAALFDFKAQGFEITKISVPDSAAATPTLNARYFLDSDVLDGVGEDVTLLTGKSSGKFLLMSESMNNSSVPTEMKANIELKMVSYVAEPKVTVQKIEASSAGKADQDNSSTEGLPVTDVTVADPEAEAVAVGFATDFKGIQGGITNVFLKIGFDYNANAEFDETGITFYETAKLPAALPTIPDSNISLAVNSSCDYSVKFTGFSLKNIDKDYTFIPYVKADGKYYYGTPETLSYLDYLEKKLDDKDTFTPKAESILDAYFAAFGTSISKKYEAKLKTDYTPTGNYDITTSEGSFTSKAVVYGSMKDMALVLGFDGYADDAIAKMVMVTGVGEAELAENNGKLQLTGFPISAMTKSYEFKPYYKTAADGEKTYGTISKISYAKYLSDKIADYKKDTENSAKKELADRALTILYMLENTVKAEEETKETLKVCSFNVGMWTDGTQEGVSKGDIETTSNKIDQFLKYEKFDMFLAEEANHYFDLNKTVKAHEQSFMDNFNYYWNTQEQGWHYCVRKFLIGGKYEPQNVVIHNFKDTKSERAYVTFDITTEGGKTINFILCHLTYGSGATNPRPSELAELSELLGTYEYGVITGDFNVSATSEYDTYFSKFNKANHGEFGDFETYVNNAATKCLDNIITTKSISLSDVYLGDVDVSDHIPIIATLTLN